MTSDSPFRAQGGEHWAYWLVLLYIIFEYLRPQTMYPALDIIPWGKAILVVTIIIAYFENALFKVKNVANVYINLFLAVIILSTIFALSPQVSIAGLKKFLALYLAYYLITNVVNTEKRFFAFMCLFLFFIFQ